MSRKVWKVWTVGIVIPLAAALAFPTATAATEASAPPQTGFQRFVVRPFDRVGFERAGFQRVVVFDRGFVRAHRRDLRRPGQSSLVQGGAPAHSADVAHPPSVGVRAPARASRARVAGEALTRGCQRPSYSSNPLVERILRWMKGIRSTMEFLADGTTPSVGNPAGSTHRPGAFCSTSPTGR